MRIVYIYTGLTTTGGADRVIVEKANYFAEKCGYEVYIITDGQKGRTPSFPLSPNVQLLDVAIDFSQQYAHGFLKRGLIYFRLMSQYKQKLSRLIHDLRPDIVISTLGRDADFITKLKDNSKKIAEVHIAKEYIRNLHLMRKRKGLYSLVSQIWMKKMEKVVSQFDAFVVLTDNDARQWKHIRKATVIPNSLPFYPEITSICENHKILSIGRLSEQKGFDLLIQAWQIVNVTHPNWHIYIYGEGSLRKELETQISKAGINDTFHLEEPVTNIVEKYTESSFYVMSSRFEGFGMVLIEAMACGLPCVSFNCPHGPSDIIHNDVDGLLAENNNISSLAEKICYLIEHKDKRKRMGLQARENIKRFNRDEIMGKWVNLLDDLTKSRS